jgi:hypothetical protein
MKRNLKTEKFKMYGFHCCRMLANSPHYLDALKNADSMAGMVVFLDYMWRHQHVDISSGYAKIMDDSPLGRDPDPTELGCDRPVTEEE